MNVRRYRIKVVPVASTGKRTAAGLVRRAGGCKVENVEVDVYPESPYAHPLVTARRTAGLSVRQAANRVGLSPREFSDLEAGRATFNDASDCETALARMTMARRHERKDRP
jgi:ribosome-binding protein aMBF1 (putative translation factor)